MMLVVVVINQKLIEQGLWLKISFVVESGQILLLYYIVCVLGFGVVVVYLLGVWMWVEELFVDKVVVVFKKFYKVVEKVLMKIMGKVGLCIVESYFGGEFFELNFFDIDDLVFCCYLFNMKILVGGVCFVIVVQLVVDWYERVLIIESVDDILMLGLFKECLEGVGYFYGVVVVWGFVDLIEELISFGGDDFDGEIDLLWLLILCQLDDVFGIDDDSYVSISFGKLIFDCIDGFQIMLGYCVFLWVMVEECYCCFVVLCDVLVFFVDVIFLILIVDIKCEMMLFNWVGNNDFVICGLICDMLGQGCFVLVLIGFKVGQIGWLDVLV